jgi:hypothetical protein
MMPYQCGTELMEVRAKPWLHIAPALARSVEDGFYGVETNKKLMHFACDLLAALKKCIVPVTLIDQFNDILAGLLNITVTLSFAFENQQQGKGLSSGGLQEFGRRKIQLEAVNSFKSSQFSEKKIVEKTQAFFIQYVLYFIIGGGSLLARARSNMQSHRSGLAGLASGDWNEPVTMGSRTENQLDMPAKQDLSSKEVNHVPRGK